MDIFAQAEIALRRAGYDTSAWTGVEPRVVCFENASVIGFVHTYLTAAALLDSWRQDQETVLARYSAALRAAGQKAWNVYSIS